MSVLPAPKWPMGLLLASLLVCPALACRPARAETSVELDAPFELARLWQLGLDPAQPALSEVGLEARFVAVDGAGAPLPHALLEFVWQEGGRIALQTDEFGALWMRFPAPSTVGGATVWLKAVPMGQSFVGHEYQSYARSPESGRLRVHVQAYSDAQ